jgi:hypothetical protein
MWVRALATAFMATCVVPAAYAGTHGQFIALSEIKREELPPPTGTVVPPDATSPQIPAPAPITPQADPNASPLDDVTPQNTGPDDATGNDQDVRDPARPNIDPNAPLPAIEYDLTKLPDAVRATHDKIVAAAKTGNIDNLTALIGSGEDVTQFSLTDDEQANPLAFLKSLSGDEGGQEILAILLEIMDAGYVHLDAGTPQELYVWPYFFAIPLEKLDATQRVELFKIVTSGDVEDMKSFGTYIFYRAGISPDGKWRFFLAGE